MQTIDFSGIHKINCTNISRSSSLAFASFLIFGVVNVAGLASTIGQRRFFETPAVTIESVLLVISCILTALAFRKASAGYSTVVSTEGDNLDVNTAAGQQLQKAFVWASLVIALILIRSVQFHVAYDMIAK